MYTKTSTHAAKAGEPDRDFLIAFLIRMHSKGLYSSTAVFWEHMYSQSSTVQTLGENLTVGSS